MSLDVGEKQATRLELSEVASMEGFHAYKKGECYVAKAKMEEALAANPYDMLAIVILSLLDPDSKNEEGLYASEAHIKAFEATTKSPHKLDQYAVTANLIARLSETMGLQTVNLADIGIGTGAFELELIKRLGGRNLQVTALEPSDEMLKISRKTLEGRGVPYGSEKCSAQDMPEEVIAKIRDKIDFVLAMHSIHHGTTEEKRQMLRNIRGINPKYFVLNDGNSDHESDLPAFSEELAVNVRRIFSIIYEDQCKWADEHFPDRPELKVAFRKFNFDDAKGILTRDYPTVRDYHRSAARWKTLLEEEGFEIVDPQTLEDINEGVDGETEIAEDVAYIRITQGFRLYFALIARPIRR